MKFSEFNLSSSVMEGVESLGFTEATPIQVSAIPAILEENDILGCAQTGTGKTAAFVLPLLHKAEQYQQQENFALILCPTRELAVQIDQQIEALSYFTPVSSRAVYGGLSGESFGAEKKALSGGLDIITATPGKFLSHLRLGYVDLSKLKFLVLDEADRMLDMGFIDDINEVISKIPEDCTKLLFSATMPPKIRSLAKKILNNPTEINFSVSKPAEKILQLAYSVYPEQKLAVIKDLMSQKKEGTKVVFCKTKKEVDSVGRELKKYLPKSATIHSGLEQPQREDIIQKFKSGEVDCIVATDIISRGIDIDTISLVINYDVPGDPEDYVHRVGRTARAEREGVAITFITPDEQNTFARIEEVIEKTVFKMPLGEQFGKAPEYNPSNRNQKKGFRKKFKK